MSKRRAELEVSAGGIVFRRVPGESARFLLIKDSYNNWGFPKGHLEGDESPAEAALRETAEETGLSVLKLQGPIRVIDWHFRFRGRHIHKYCHFFLFESPDGEPCPQIDEGITACQWRPLNEALEVLSYDNARGVLKRAGEMVRTLVAVGAGRPGGRTEGQTAGRSDGRAPAGDGQPQEENPYPVDHRTSCPPVHPSAPSSP
jgi:8-oxo-dGTP pyrophosphatase MutT (NUDIX family)